MTMFFTSEYRQKFNEGNVHDEIFHELSRPKFKRIKSLIS